MVFSRNSLRECVYQNWGLYSQGQGIVDKPTQTDKYQSKYREHNAYARHVDSSIAVNIMIRSAVNNSFENLF